MAAGAGRIKYPPSFAARPTPEPICEWAERMVRVTTGGRPGLLRLDPYQRATLEAMVDPAVKEAVLMEPSQLGKSLKDSIVVGWHIDQSPCDMLIIHPSQAVRDRFAREKLSPILLGIPEVKAKIRLNNRDRLAVDGFDFDGGSLTISTSGAVGGTTGATSKVVIADEVDKYQSGAAVLNALEQRTTAFRDGMLVVSSTPSVKGDSAIEAEFRRTDQREWQVPCPLCGAYQMLDAWPAATPEGIRCRHCAETWSEAQRCDAIRRGEWVATAEGQPGRVGFHLSQLASLNTPLAQTLDMASGYSQQDIQTQIMAMPYEDVMVETPTPDMIVRCERPFAEPAYYSVGVDVQARTLEAVIISLPEHMERMHMEAAVTVARTLDYRCWHDLRESIARVLAQLPATSRHDVPVSVDGRGGWYEWTQEGLRSAWGGRAMTGDPANVSVVMGDGAPSLEKPLWGARRGGKDGYRHTIVSSDRGKADLYDAIRSAHLTFAPGIADAVVNEILSERLLVREGRDHRSGRAGRITYRWVPLWKGIDNHALDALCYAWCRASVMPLARE